MNRRAVPLDTDPEVFEMMVERWRTMTVADRCALVTQLNADVEGFARAGINAQFPDATEVEVNYQLARRRYGSELADAAYMDLLANQ